MSKELPGAWGELLGPKGIHSYRDLANAADIPTGTAHRLVTGRTSAETVNKVADAVFGGDRDLVWRLRGSERRDHGDWSLPAEASLLTEDQRKAILAVVQAMVPAEREDVMGNAEHPAPMIEQPMLKAARKTDRLTAAERAEALEQRERRLPKGEIPGDSSETA